MGLTATERLLLVINLENKGAIAGMEATGAAARSNLGAVEAGSAAASSRLLAVGAAGVVAGALVGKGIKSAYDAVDETARSALKLQRVTGETAENSSAIAYAAQQTGIPVEKLATSIGILSTKGEKLKGIGVSFDDANGRARPFLDVLEDISDRIAGMENGAEKNALVRSLFGRGGTELIPLLNKGRDGIEAMKRAAASQGLLLGQATLDDIRQNIVATYQLDAAWQGLRIQFGNAVVPQVTAGLSGLVSVVRGLASAVDKVPGLSTLLADATLVGGAFALIGGGASVIAAAGSKVMAGWGKVSALFGGIATEEELAARGALQVAAANDKAAAAAERRGVAQKAAAESAAASVAPAALSSTAVAEVGVLAGGAIVGGNAATKRAATASLTSTRAGLIISGRASVADSKPFRSGVNSKLNPFPWIASQRAVPNACAFVSRFVKNF